MKLYMFLTVPPSFIRGFSLYLQQCYMSYRFVASFRAGSGCFILSTDLSDIYHSCVYSEKLLMMGRWIFQNMWISIPK